MIRYLDVLRVFFISFFLTLLIPNIGSLAKNKNNFSIDLSSLNVNNKSENNDLKIKLNLDNLEDLFKKNNEEIRIFKSKIEQAKRDFKSQLALWSPKLILKSTNLPSYVSGQSSNNKTNENNSTNTFTKSLDINLEWDLIDFSRNPNIKVSKLNLDKAKLNYKIKYRELYKEILEIFLKFKSANEEIKVAKQAIALSEISLKDAKDRFKAGIGNKLEVLEADTQLRKDQKFLVSKMADVKKSKNLLIYKLNLNTKDVVLDDSKLNISGIWTTSINSSLEMTINEREEFKNLKIDQLINKNNLYLKSSVMKPKVSIYNTYSISTITGESDVVSPDNSKRIQSEENTVGLKFSWTLFDGGKTRQNYKSSKEKEKELEINLSVVQEQIINDIRNQFVDLDVSMKNILKSYRQIIFAREALDLSLMRLKAGATNQREVIRNLSELTDSKSNYIQDVTNYNINIEKLKLDTGIKKIDDCNYFIDKKVTFLKNDIYEDINAELLKNICQNNILQKL